MAVLSTAVITEVTYVGWTIWNKTCFIFWEVSYWPCCRTLIIDRGVSIEKLWKCISTNTRTRDTTASKIQADIFLQIFSYHSRLIQISGWHIFLLMKRVNIFLRWQGLKYLFFIMIGLRYFFGQIWGLRYLFPKNTRPPPESQLVAPLHIAMLRIVSLFTNQNTIYFSWEAWEACDFCSMLLGIDIFNFGSCNILNPDF